MRLRYSSGVTLAVEFDREEDGRWIADIEAIPGCIVYGATRQEALARVEALALHVVAERLEDGEITAEDVASVTFVVPAAARAFLDRGSELASRFRRGIEGRSMKVEPVRLTTPYPSVAQMAKTLGASQREVNEARRLVRKVLKPRKAAGPRRATRGQARGPKR
jgi:predicted RNase H-like HicB family nuclease